jgi:catechol 2,3-dioxygenase-like lactoylglutathione lyase family enzyme
MSRTKFDIVTLDSPNTNELAVFWARVLGLVEIEREDGDRWILLGDASGARVMGFQRGEHVLGTVHLDLSCSQVDFVSERERLLQLGAGETRDVRTESYGHIANFKDPDGNLFDLCAYVTG